MLTDRMDAEAFDAAGPSFKVVANYAVGFNNIDLKEADARAVSVTNTPDVLTAATADTAWGLLMMAARRLGEAERTVRAGGFHGWGPNDWLGVDIEGKTLGIIGAGRIGTTIARRARGWDMSILYTHRSGKEDFERATCARLVGRDELLRQSDFISLSVPLTDSTRHLIGKRELALMKPTAVLINTARGPVIDEAALVQALRNRQIFAAGLDVYEREPELEAGLVELENVVLLPHLGSATIETRSEMALIAARNIIACLKGETPPNLVNHPGNQ